MQRHDDLRREIESLDPDESLRVQFSEDPSVLIASLMKEFDQTIEVQAHRENETSWSAEFVRRKKMGCCGTCGGHG